MKKFLIEQALNPLWLPVFRSGTGLLLLCSFWSFWPDFGLFYSPDGLADPQLLGLGPSRLDVVIGDLKGSWLLLLYSGLCILLTAGVFTRFTVVLLLLLHNHIFISIAVFSYGFDYFCATCLFFCVIFPEKHVHVLSLRILQFHLCIVYFFAGFGKLLGPSWRNGEALWKALHLPGFTGHYRPDIDGLGQYPFFWAVLGWMVILVEIAYPVFIWFPSTRNYWLLAIMGLHAGIALFMGLYFFSLILVLFNVSAFYIPYLAQIRLPLQITLRNIIHTLSPPAPAQETPDASSRLIQNRKE